MEDNVISMKEIKKESKRRERKEWFEKKVESVTNWFNNNRELAMIVIPAGLAVGGFIIKGSVKAVNGAIRTHNLKKEEDLKNLYCYDRSLGHYWKLRRELTNDEWVEIDKRKKAGERLADILSELKVLK